jgi:homocysteine S-methyltransferase
MAGFPAQREGVLYLAEGGQETEIMYRHGHDLPEFAMFPLLDDPRAVSDLRGMYERYLEVAARNQFVALMGGLDYRASPDWSTKLGFDHAALVDWQIRAIDFLRDVSKPFKAQLPGVMIVGTVGPRGDAYALNRTITTDEAEDYHSTQIETLKRGGVDVVSAMTFNSTAEAIGVSRAVARAGLPLIVNFTVDSAGRLMSGHQLLAPHRVRTGARTGRLDRAGAQLSTERGDDGEAAALPDWASRRWQSARARRADGRVGAALSAYRYMGRMLRYVGCAS